MGKLLEALKCPQAHYSVPGEHFSVPGGHYSVPSKMIIFGIMMFL